MDDTPEPALFLRIDKNLRQAVMQGETSIGFREYIQEVYVTLNQSLESGFVGEDQCFIMKVELYKSMIWLGEKLNEIQRNNAN